jgi:hypothetical protein
MYPEIESFKSWLTCHNPVGNRGRPTSSTRTHYTSDLVLFFTCTHKKLANGYIHRLVNVEGHAIPGIIIPGKVLYRG